MSSRKNNVEMSSKKKEALQDFYFSVRELSSLDFPRRGLQKAFEELVYSFMKKESWQPTHITKAALVEYFEKKDTRLQRAHGVYSDRLERFDRTMEIIEGPERSFSDWWDFFLYHDKTVLMTRSEHSSGIIPGDSDLVEIPSVPTSLFENAGFKAKIRKNVELVWMKKAYKSLEKDSKQSISAGSLYT